VLNPTHAAKATPPAAGPVTATSAAAALKPPDSKDFKAGSPVAGTSAQAPAKTPDIAVAIRAIPGIKTLVEVHSDLAGVRSFKGTFSQPVDHAKPGGAHFNQAFTLLHRSTTAPMVLTMSGYAIPETAKEEEPTARFGTNQLEVEHRFFGTSVPDPKDWTLLTIRQAAEDVHALTQALKAVYPRPWLSYGISKGGCALIYHRRFFPGDVAGTMACGSPNHLERGGRRLQ